MGLLKRENILIHPFLKEDITHIIGMVICLLNKSYFK